jgi:hypothetical protein
MTEVETIQEESTEATPNPYNQKKAWHTDDVMPKHGDTAEGLFFERPQAQTEEVQEEAKAEPQPSNEKAYKRPDYKKRYDDLKKHYDNSLNNFRAREQELLQKVTETQPEYVAPKTPEELEQFKAQYPDVYEVVESVAHLQSEEKLATLQERFLTLRNLEVAMNFMHGQRLSQKRYKIGFIIIQTMQLLLVKPSTFLKLKMES